MHERIEYVDKSGVKIGSMPQIRLDSLTGSGLRISYGDTFFDVTLEEVAALLEALNCLTHTRSFEALQDTSAVAFPGKQVRYDDEECVVRFCPRYNGVWITKPDSTILSIVNHCDIAPLTPPTPRYRPYRDAREAVELIGKKISYYTGPWGTVWSVSPNGIVLDGCSSSTLAREWDYSQLCELWTLNGHPVGVREDA